MAGRKKLKILAISLGVIVAGLGAAAWSMWPSVEDVPEVLDAIDPEVSISALELEAQGPMPAVRLGDLTGKTVFLMIEGRESMTGGEGKALRRAVHRWVLPDDVAAFSVGDAPAGAKVMKGKIEREFLGPMREEMKLPIYVDFGGSFTDAFALPKGHLGVVVIDPAGEVAYRHAGDLDEAEVAKIAELLGAEEPPPGPPAPEFAFGGLDQASCAEQACVLVFLDAKVARSEIPGLEDGGFEGEMKETFEQIRKPSIRLARIFAADWTAEDRAKIAGAIVGEGEGWSVDGWPFVAPDDAGAAAAREAFGIGDEAGMVIIKDGRVELAEAGLIPFWQLSMAADLLGIEAKEYGKREDKRG